MSDRARAAAEEIVRWWRDESGPWLNEPDYTQLVDRVADAVAQAVKETSEALQATAKDAIKYQDLCKQQAEEIELLTTTLQRRGETNAELAEELARLRAAGKRLLAELSDVQIESVREGAGNTNAAVLRQRRDELAECLRPGGAPREGAGDEH